MKQRFLQIFACTAILSVLITPLYAKPTSSTIPISVTGELTILEVDDFDNRVSKTLYHLSDLRTKKTYRLKFPGEPPEKLGTGDIVTVRGKAKGRVLRVSEIGGEPFGTEGLVTASISGEQKTIVIVANFLDQSVSCSVSDIQNRVFSDPLNQSVDDLYQEMSFGQVWLSGPVIGPYAINYGSTSGCNISAWADAADAAVRASGVDLSVYNRKIYVMPRNNPCGYTGVGTVGGNPSRAWIFRCDGSDTYAHELGHNLNMNHASTLTDEYGDVSDIMGYGGYGLRQVNAAHQDQTGWLDPLQIEGIMESGTYTIAPIELSSSMAISPQVLTIPKPDTAESYYLSYRQPLGFDSGLASTYLQGVSIHRRKPGTTLRTYLLTVLTDGGSFTDAVNGVTVTQLGHTSEFATVRVSSIPTCVASAPAVSLAPASQSAQAGTAVTYSVSVTNRDSTACSPSTFSLAASLPAGWTGTVSPATFTLSSGAGGSSTLSATSPVSAAAGDYALSVNVSGGAIASHAASGTATYTVLPRPACVAAAPQISISPTTQTGQAGATLGYLVSVTNRDSVACQQSTFALARSVPSGWAGVFSSGTLTLAPGASGSSTLSITSLPSTASGNYGITAMASDAAVSSHAASVNATYAVVGDSVPPTVPAALTAKLVRGKVNLSWAASTDNVGVKGYRVWRNDVAIGQSVSTSYTDSSVVPGQTYTYFVTAYDAAGNMSSSSNKVSVTVGGAKKK